MSDPVRGPPSPYDAAPDPHRGSRVGRYQVISQLSVGGMAELFLGFTSGPGGFRKYAALKRILPDARSDEQFERMFLDEARITAALNHPHIGQVFELGQDPEGLFLAMEFIAGQNMAQVVSGCARAQTPLPLGFGLSVVRDVCLALHHAHAFTTPAGKPQPVIHRDVAPKNVMVAYDGAVKLLDFGIAKARDGAARTQAGMVKGTTGYMSPEQVRGDPLDGRSDLFAAGVMLHEFITGGRLFSGASEVQEMEMVLDTPIPEPVSRGEAMPRGLSAVVFKALAREREQRYANGRDMARALEAAAGGLLYDTEQRAAFLARHFGKQKENTRRLMESADGVPDAPLPDEPPPALAVAQAPAPVPAPAPAPEKPHPRAPPAPRPRAPRAAEASPTAILPTADTRAHTAPRASATQKSPGMSLLAKAFGLPLLALGVALGVVGLLEMTRADRAADVAALTPSRDLSPITPLPGTEPERPSPPPPGPAPTREPPREAPAADRDDAEDAPVRGGKPGWLTLVVIPEAEVTLNGRSLGKTPLFKVQVPSGQHRLRIKGADGKRRELSVPIAPGKTAQFRLALTDIPER